MPDDDDGSIWPLAWANAGLQLTGDPRLLLIATGPTIACVIAWTIATARALAPRAVVP